MGVRAALRLCELRGAGEVNCGELRQREERVRISVCVCVCGQSRGKLDDVCVGR